jgi:chloramphenicol O-acetyltransferase
MSATVLCGISNRTRLTSLTTNYNVNVYYMSQFKVNLIDGVIAYKFKIIKPSGVFYIKTLYTWHKCNKNVFFWGELVSYEFGQLVELGEYKIAVTAIVSSTYNVQESDYGEYYKIFIDNYDLVI